MEFDGHANMNCLADTGALSDEENEASGEENLPSAGSEEESDEDEEEENDESDIDEERLARGAYRKPGARDRYGKRNK